MRKRFEQQLSIEYRFILEHLLTSTIDIIPSLAGITGAQLPDAEIDVNNILDIWKGKEGVNSYHDFFFYITKDKPFARSIGSTLKKKYTISRNEKMDEVLALYNLKDDIDESNNLIDKESEIAAHLAKSLEEHLARINMKY